VNYVDCPGEARHVACNQRFESRGNRAFLFARQERIQISPVITINPTNETDERVVRLHRQSSGRCEIARRDGSYRRSQLAAMNLGNYLGNRPK